MNGSEMNVKEIINSIATCRSNYRCDMLRLREPRPGCVRALVKRPCMDVALWKCECTVAISYVAGVLIQLLIANPPEINGESDKNDIEFWT